MRSVHKRRHGFAITKGTVAVFFTTVFLLVGAFSLAHYLKAGKVLLDEHFCPVSGEKTRFAVLVDKSGKWEPEDVARVKDILQTIYREVPAQGRLLIYSITGNLLPIDEQPASTEVSLVFDACNPPNSEAECNELFEGCQQGKRNYKRAFAVPLEKLVATLILPGESSYSPLLETVGAMVKDNKGEELKLYIVSDFMENHIPFRFYDEVPFDTELIAQYPLPKKAKITVQGYFIQRRTLSVNIQNAAQAAWVGYFERQGIPATFSPVFTTE